MRGRLRWRLRRCSIREFRIVNPRHQRAGHVLHAFQAVQRGIGLHADALDGGIQFLQPREVPMNVPLVPMPGDKMRHPPIRLPPDFRRGRRGSGLSSWRRCCIGRDKNTSSGCSSTSRRTYRCAPSVLSVGSVRISSAPYACKLCLRSMLAFAGSARRDLVAALGGDHRVGDACVAAGGVDEDFVLGQQPAALAVEDHRQRRAVLHAAAGVVPLGLGEDPHRGRQRRR